MLEFNKYSWTIFTVVIVKKTFFCKLCKTLVLLLDDRGRNKTINQQTVSSWFHSSGPNSGFRENCHWFRNKWQNYYVFIFKRTFIYLVIIYDKYIFKCNELILIHRKLLEVSIAKFMISIHCKIYNLTFIFQIIKLDEIITKVWHSF